jgi:Uma2 family endonuclease
MHATAKKTDWTEEQLMMLPDIGHKAELLDGRVEMSPAGFDHGDLGLYIGGLLRAYVRRKRLGRAADSSTGFWMKSGNMRSPDVSFVAAARLPKDRTAPRGFFNGAPDLAVEILSPTDSRAAMRRRIREYFDSGTRLAWVVDPQRRCVTVYRSKSDTETLKAGQRLDGGAVVPGFRLGVTELFDELEQ